MHGKQNKFRQSYLELQKDSEILLASSLNSVERQLYLTTVEITTQLPGQIGTIIPDVEGLTSFFQVHSLAIKSERKEIQRNEYK